MKLLEAKKNKIEKIIGKLGSFGSSAGGGSAHGGNSFSSGSSFSGSSSGAAEGVQSYHAQPAPQQNYQQQPVVLHLYQFEQAQAQAQSHNVGSGASSYQAPSNTYGPPNHQPAAPISSAQVSSQVQSVDTSYLPPHGNCQDNSHYH